ncbi:DUF6783 domain-containing protein [uncultured Robinsoniella sp.]
MPVRMKYSHYTIAPDEGCIAGYVIWIRGKYDVKWGVQIAGMND